MSSSLAVVTPSYNDAPFLSECVESVRVAAERAGFQVEHAIVDDASTDGTPALLASQSGLLTKRFPVNRGTSAALNAAVRLTTAPWLLVLASDDAVTPDAFGDWRGAIAQHPTANVIYSDLELFGARRGSYRVPPFESALMRERNILPGCSFLRRSVFDAVGGFDPAMRTAQDWDFWVRADHVVGLVPRKLAMPAVRYRFHAAPRLHDESVRNIETIRRIVRGRTPSTAVLAGAP